MRSFPARRSRSLTADVKYCLTIQSNVPGRLTVGLVDASGRIIDHAERIVAWHGAERLLQVIAQLLRQHHLAVRQLFGLIVVRGPGPFTAVRTGLIVANTFSTIHSLPAIGVVSAGPLRPAMTRNLVRRLINQTQTGALVRPWYGRQPNITRPIQRRAGRRR